jgi:hypothetical protein
MELDPASLQRVKEFMELIIRAKQQGQELSFVNTPTEQGDNINVLTTFNGEKATAGILFWDVNFLQNNGLADTLDEDDMALGVNMTDGLVEDAEQILDFIETKQKELSSS